VFFCQSGHPSVMRLDIEALESPRMLVPKTSEFSETLRDFGDLRSIERGAAPQALITPLNHRTFFLDMHHRARWPISCDVEARSWINWAAKRDGQKTVTGRRG
jgi:hypothetical protein